MDRVTGTSGERMICIVVRNLNEVITAFPVASRTECRG